MHEIRLSIKDEIYEKFMGLIDILPKDSISVKEIGATTAYPTISFDEAKSKVENAVLGISRGEGRNAQTVFKELLS